MGVVFLESGERPEAAQVEQFYCFSLLLEGDGRVVVEQVLVELLGRRERVLGGLLIHYHRALCL